MSQARPYVVKVRRTWQGCYYREPSSGSSEDLYGLLAYTAEDAFFEACRRLGLDKVRGYGSWGDSSRGSCGDARILSVGPKVEAHDGEKIVEESQWER